MVVRKKIDTKQKRVDNRKMNQNPNPGVSAEEQDPLPDSCGE